MQEAIHRELPFLRRFARALVGRQAAADRLVATAMRAVAPDLAALRASAGSAAGSADARHDGDIAALVAAPPSLAASEVGRIRLLLFRALIDAHTDADAGREHETLTDERIVASRVRSLPRASATALLLAALERFSLPDIAFALRLPPDEAKARLAEAQAVLDAQAATGILIIEDEPVIAMDIAGIVEQSGHRVLGIATTRDEAIALARSKRPGLVLADIQLADDSSGIKAVDDIMARRPKNAEPLPVIFITAYPERLLDDEREEPSILITKPFSEHLLRVAIAQALDISGRPLAVG